MSSLVSVCIPTYKRSDLVLEAVASALGQTHGSVEVVVSDDSPDDRTERALADFVSGGRVRYVRNAPALRQARNVNQLLDMAAGEFVVLLHDDDLLLPDAVERFIECFTIDPNLSAVFGKQYLTDAKGVVDEAGSVSLNEAYHRTSAHAGKQPSAMRSALVAQFPNDGYMVRTEVARAVRYRDDPKVGDACDYDFGLRLAARGGGFCFIDRYTAKYRMTGVSILTGNNYTNLTFDLVQSLQLSAELEPLRQEKLSRLAVPAVNKWLALGEWRAARRVYGSKAYGWKRRRSPRGLFHALMLGLPAPVSKRVMKRLKRT